MFSNVFSVYHVCCFSIPRITACDQVNIDQHGVSDFFRQASIEVSKGIMLIVLVPELAVYVHHRDAFSSITDLAKARLGEKLVFERILRVLLHF